MVPYNDIGTVDDGRGNKSEVRWDEQTGIVQVRIYHHPTHREANRDWMTIGLAKSSTEALHTALVWVRG
jgi:hypothetical protein